MYDSTIGRFLSEDPLGFSSGDANFYRYVGNDPLDFTDPSGLERLPRADRGTWVEGTPGNGTFQYHDTLENRSAGVAGTKVQFANQHIGLGAFPAEAYYGGNAAAASVEIEVVKGTNADFSAADKAMRLKRNDPNWQRPPEYTWNHAGEPESKVLELVDRPTHRAVAHEGPASPPRAAARAAKMGDATTVRATNLLTVYLTARDALQAVGVLNPDYEVATGALYYYVANDKSVFYVQPAGWFSSPARVFIAGPRQGKTETISNADVVQYKADAEVVWGRYVLGSLLRDPQFIPGTERTSLPLYENDDYGIPYKSGWVDEEGVHRCPAEMVLKGVI